MSDQLSPVDDPVAGPFFVAAAQGRLVVQRCNSCAALRWPPLSGCPECRSRKTTWVDVAPSGTVWSFVVYHRAFQASLEHEIPYSVAVVELHEGPYMVGRLSVGDEPVAVGDRVDAEFLDVGGVPTVRWRIAAEPDGTNPPTGLRSTTRRTCDGKA